MRGSLSFLVEMKSRNDVKVALCSLRSLPLAGVEADIQHTQKLLDMIRKAIPDVRQ
jgi:hypothetical protein